MHFFKVSAITTFLAVIVAATPAPEADDATVIVNMYAGDTCNDRNDQFSVASGGYRCVPVPSAKRSLQASGG
jgi:hypothetical protein